MGVIQFDGGRPQIVGWTAFGQKLDPPTSIVGRYGTFWYNVVLHYDGLWHGVVWYHRMVWFCIVWCGPLLATQLSLNYQIIPHIPQDHTGHLSRQASIIIITTPLSFALSVYNSKIFKNKKMN